MPRWSIVLPLCAGAILVMAGGCLPSISNLHLEQAEVSGPPRQLELISEQVWWATHGGARRLLAELPLPGAGTGRAMFLLYLQTQDPTRADTTGPAAEPLRGFLIQTRGRGAGLTQIIDGTARSIGPPPSGKAAWAVRVDLRFDDGSRLSGLLRACREDWRLLQFENRTHSADVRELSAPLPANAAQTP